MLKIRKFVFSGFVFLGLKLLFFSQSFGYANYMSGQCGGAYQGLAFLNLLSVCPPQMLGQNPTGPYHGGAATDINSSLGLDPITLKPGWLRELDISAGYTETAAPPDYIDFNRIQSVLGQISSGLGGQPSTGQIPNGQVQFSPYARNL